MNVAWNGPLSDDDLLVLLTFRKGDPKDYPLMLGLINERFKFGVRPDAVEKSPPAKRNSRGVLIFPTGGV
jgi:hypothetical protein